MFENAFTGGSHLRFTQASILVFQCTWSFHSFLCSWCFHHFLAHHPTFKNEKSCRCINHIFSKCNRQQFDMQLVYYIHLNMLTFIFQSCEWWNDSLLQLWQYFGGVYSMAVSNFCDNVQCRNERKMYLLV